MDEATVAYQVENPGQATNGAAATPAPRPLRERILRRKGGQRREHVPVPEWDDILEGDKLYIKALSSKERDAFEESLAMPGEDGERKMSLENFRAKLVARTAVDADGRQVFSPEDAEALGDLDAAPLQRLFNVAQRLGGMSSQDVKELTKNSDPAPSDGSTSA